MTRTLATSLGTGLTVGLLAKAREVTDHPVLTHLARVGLTAYGAMHLLIAFLAARMALGLRGADADQTGALQTVGAGPGGRALLWAIGLGLLSLGLWQADERLPALTDDALRIPGGTAAVCLVAAGVVAVGLYTLVRGFTGGFMRDIDLTAAPDRWEPVIEAVGRVGYVAKGIAFGLVGVLLWRAATSADVTGATGLDGAMTAIAGVSAGPWLLAGVAAGFAAFGGYALARARYPDRDPSS